MDNKATTKRMIGAVVLVLVAALLLAWLLKGKKHDVEQDMVADQPASPIVGFPGVNSGANEEKPDLTGQGSTEAPGADMAGAEQTTPDMDGGDSAKSSGLMPEVTMPKVADDTTGFQVRPAGGEVRDIVDTDGKSKPGTGSMGSGDEKAAPSASAEAQGGSTGMKQESAGGSREASSASTSTRGSASSRDYQASSESSSSSASGKKSSSVVLVGERKVPEAASVESKPATKPASTAKPTATVTVTSSKPESSVSAASGKAGYVIQVLASSSKGKADGVRQSLVKDGYPVFVTQAKVNGNAIYRVRVGTYQKKDEAVAVQTRMKARYTQNEFVQNSFVTNNK